MTNPNAEHAVITVAELAELRERLAEAVQDRNEYRQLWNQIVAGLQCPACKAKLGFSLVDGGQWWNCDGCKHRWPVHGVSPERFAEVERQATEMTWKIRAADTLADTVAALVQRKVIDFRSAAADALLDYRDPPRNERTDLLAAAQECIAQLEQQLAESRSKSTACIESFDCANGSHSDACPVPRLERELEDARFVIEETSKEARLLQQQLDSLDSFEGVLALLTSILDDRYPPKIFAGKSNDLGDQLVARTRAMLQRLNKGAPAR